MLPSINIANNILARDQFHYVTWPPSWPSLYWGAGAGLLKWAGIHKACLCKKTDFKVDYFKTPFSDACLGVYLTLFTELVANQMVDLLWLQVINNCRKNCKLLEAAYYITSRFYVPSRGAQEARTPMQDKERRRRCRVREVCVTKLVLHSSSSKPFF